MDPQTAGAQDPDQEAAIAAGNLPPAEAATAASPSPEEGLRLPDDDDDWTDEHVAAMERQYYSQPRQEGESIQGERVAAQPAETPAPAEPESPDPAAAPDARPPQYRSRPATPEGEAYQLLLKAGVPEKEAAARAFGLTTPAAPDETPAPATPDSGATLLPAAAALAAHDAELDRLEQAHEDAVNAYDTEATSAAFRALNKAQRVRQELVSARDREVVNAAAAELAAWQEAEQANVALALDRFPGLDNPNGAQRQQFDALWAQAVADNEPFMGSPDRALIIAEKAAAACYAASLPRSASAPAAPSRVPAPVPAARFSPATAGAAAPPATPQYSPDALEDMSESEFQALTAKTVAGLNGSLARR